MTNVVMNMEEKRMRENAILSGINSYNLECMGFNFEQIENLIDLKNAGIDISRYTPNVSHHEMRRDYLSTFVKMKY